MDVICSRVVLVVLVVVVNVVLVTNGD